MKKNGLVIATILLGAFIITSCGFPTISKEPKQYTVKEMRRVYDKVEEMADDELRNLSDEELFGKSPKDDEREEHYQALYHGIQAKALSEKVDDLKPETNVNLTGVYRPGGDRFDGKYYFALTENVNQPKLYGIMCIGDKADFDSLNEGDLITVNGIFFSKDRRNEYVSYCKPIDIDTSVETSSYSEKVGVTTAHEENKDSNDETAQESTTKE